METKEGREFETSVFEYLVKEKSYPKTEIKKEAALAPSIEGYAYRADFAILDSKRSEFIALIEVKQSRENKVLREAISQLLHCRRILGKPYIPLYLFFPSISGRKGEFNIAQVLPDGDTKDIYPDEFPAYDTLINGDRSSKKVNQTAAVRETIDTFQVRCIFLSIVVAAMCILDVLELLQLTTKQLILAGISGALLILPFAAKFNMLGIEFERFNPKGSDSSEEE